MCCFGITSSKLPPWAQISCNATRLSTNKMSDNVHVNLNFKSITIATMYPPLTENMLVLTMWNFKNIRIIIRIIIPLFKAVITNNVLVVIRHQQCIVAVHFKVHRSRWDGLGRIKHVWVISVEHGDIVAPFGALNAIHSGVAFILKSKPQNYLDFGFNAVWIYLKW